MKSTYKEILKQLEKRQFANVYFLAGEEPLFIDKISDYIEEHVMEETDRDFNQSVYYAKETNPAEVIAQAREFPFGVEKRVVIVKEAKDWRSLDLIMAYCANPTTTTILVICYKYGKMPSNKALNDAVTFKSPYTTARIFPKLPVGTTTSMSSPAFSTPFCTSLV